VMQKSLITLQNGGFVVDEQDLVSQNNAPFRVLLCFMSAQLIARRCLQDRHRQQNRLLQPSSSSRMPIAPETALWR